MRLFTHTRNASMARIKIVGDHGETFRCPVRLYFARIAYSQDVNRKAGRAPGDCALATRRGRGAKAAGVGPRARRPAESQDAMRLSSTLRKIFIKNVPSCGL